MCIFWTPHGVVINHQNFVTPKTIKNQVFQIWRFRRSNKRWATLGARLHAVEACQWFLRSVSVHGGLRIQRGGQWTSLCGWLCACTREVLGCCRVADFVRVRGVRREHKGKRCVWHQIVLGENYGNKSKNKDNAICFLIFSFSIVILLSSCLRYCRLCLFAPCSSLILGSKLEWGKVCGRVSVERIPSRPKWLHKCVVQILLFFELIKSVKIVIWCGFNIFRIN